VSYSYVQFGELTLPDMMPGDEVEEIGLGPARDGRVTLPDGGWFDAYGDEQAPLEPMTVQVPATLQAETVAALDALYQSWQALVGTRGALYRQWSGDGSEQWRDARLMEIRVVGGGYTHNYLNMVLVFALVGLAWHGDAHGNNLVSNGDFGQDALTGWVFTGNGVATVTDHALQLQTLDPNIFTATYPLSVVAGARYVAMVKAKQQVAANAALTMPGSAPVVIAAAGPVEELVCTSGAMPSASEVLTLSLGPGGGDFATFDDVMVVKVGELQLLTTSPEAFELSNGGNVPVRDVVITVHAGSSAITALEIANAKTGHVSDISYDVSIVAGEELVLDCGAFSALNDGDDAWADLALESGHAIEEWLRLGPGTNAITVTFTGGGTGSWIRFEYADAWV